MPACAIVDQHPVRRAGLERFVAESGRLSVAASARCVDDLLAGDAPLDVAIVDLTGWSGDPALPAIGRVADRCPVVVTMSWKGSPGFGALLRAGARGFVADHCDGHVIVAALTTVGEGGFYVCPGLTGRFEAEMVPGRNVDPAGLAPREVETLRWIAQGLTHAQIAGRMGLTEATVNTYAKRIRAKLNAGNKAELTRIAIERGHLTR
ncbi:response regulator transcription factor [Plantactinospora sp. KBS50]|uniref:response regulator transcription factor n=1 Tax=Plantactinospora sp. KBS50 TaxID=2024580 RepID=UPI000BAA9724|nr:response regulator transcription factor [Plantactinospora sp. KBS50]ASW53455.1 hypothetical protein CIK06_03545 [Plantactinospora sp. KBS50]